MDDFMLAWVLSAGRLSHILSMLVPVQEARYRQRYLDGIVNHHHVRHIFVTRARIVQYVRRYLDERQFLEVRQANNAASALSV